MIALSIRQPWAWMILHGGKDIEIARLRAELHAAQEDARGARECARQDGARLAWWQDQFGAKTRQQTMLIADELRALRTEVEALRAGMQWQPIETAPKTGRKVIAFYLNRNGKTRTVMARWLTDEQAAETDADGVGLAGGWYECIDNWSDYTEVAIHEGEPSHWMPLPQSPAARAKGKE